MPAHGAVEAPLHHSMTNRAVILARGLGTRMRKADSTARMSGDQAQVASTGVKALIPIGRPFLDYVLSALADAGVHRICLVIGPEHDVLRRRYTVDAKPSRLSIEFAVQQEPRGTADAVLAAETWTDGEPFLVINSDNYYPVDALTRLAALDEPGLVAFRRVGLLADGQIDPARVTSFAVLDLDGEYLRRIIEKPDASTLAALGDDIFLSMNCWRFDRRIFPLCRKVPLSPRGELELPAAVQHAIESGVLGFRAVRVESAVLDLSRQIDIASVASRLEGIEVVL
jgi:glucose-1-phosphate thymidylyltransferase